MQHNKTYVGILTGNTIKFVTSVDRKTHAARWDDGKGAVVLSRVLAQDVCYGLRLNGYPAVIVSMPGSEAPQNL